jgi:uncharacterized protein (TIGR00255 family)
MTGHARAETRAPWGALAIEIRSVNQRFLDLSVRLPDALRFLEADIRQAIGKRISRGKLDINFYFNPEAASNTEVSVNTDLLKALDEAMNQVHMTMPGVLSPNALNVLQYPGVVQQPELAQDDVKADVLVLLEKALDQLIESRSAEGERLAAMILERCETIAGYAQQVREVVPQIREAMEERLRKRLDQIDVEINEGRIEQELVMFAQKADVDEEVDRLESHITAVKQALKSKQPVGRKLDFLMQEFTREANTLGSKSQGIETTNISVELKVLIEQMREQVQNIE